MSEWHQRPAAVVFDYGDTLVTFVRPDQALQRAYEEIARRLVLLRQPPLLAAQLLSEVHDRMEDAYAAHQQQASLEEIDLVEVAAAAYAELGCSLTADQLDELLRIEQEAWWDGVEVDPDAKPVIRSLRAAGIRVGLCSNAPYRVQSLHAQLAHFEFDGMFDAVVFSGALGWRKPSPRIFNAVLEALSVQPAAALMVGDSVRYDVLGARAAGMRTLLLQRDDAAPPGDAGPVIHRLRDLLKVLDVTRVI